MPDKYNPQSESQKNESTKAREVALEITELIEDGVSLSDLRTLGKGKGLLRSKSDTIRNADTEDKRYTNVSEQYNTERSAAEREISLAEEEAGQIHQDAIKKGEKTGFIELTPSSQKRLKELASTINTAEGRISQIDKLREIEEKNSEKTKKRGVDAIKTYGRTHERIHIPQEDRVPLSEEEMRKTDRLISGVGLQFKKDPNITDAEKHQTAKVGANLGITLRDSAKKEGIELSKENLRANISENLKRNYPELVEDISEDDELVA